MFHSKLFKHSFVLVLFIAVLFQITKAFHLSWTFWWFDMILHFLGGFWVSTVVFLFWNHYFSASTTGWLKIVTIILVWTFLIGIAWEIFELYFEVTSFSDGLAYWRDTASDLSMDIIGGIFGSLYSIRLNKING